MADSGGDGGCCRCCVSFILTSGLTALFMWLSLRTTNPVCSIQKFYVPALNKSSNSTSNHTIDFDLKLDNKNKDKGIYYDTLNLTFYYNESNTSWLQIANYTVGAFRQGHKKNTHRKDLVNYDLEAVFRAVSNGSKPVFTVDLKTKVRFKIIAWKTKKYKLAVRATVEVDQSGNKAVKKGIKLKSGAPEIDVCYRAHLGLLLAFSVLALLLFN